MAKNYMKKNNRKNTGKINMIILAFFLGVFVTSGIAFAQDFGEYQSAKAEYASINENIVIAEDDEAIVDEIAEPAVEDVEAEEVTAVDTTEETLVEEAVVPDVEIEEAPEVSYPHLDIDFEALADASDDIVAVIYIPALSLRYPVVQGADNDYYLHHTVEGTENASGSIFLDARANVSMNDNNSFVYGHNMKNGTMFGSLKQFLYNEELAKEDPYIYLYLNDGRVMKYHIFSYAVVSVKDDLYYPFADSEYDSYIEKAQARSEFKGDQTDDFSKRPNMITLSTCYGTQHTENFVVQAALEGVATMF